MPRLMMIAIGLCITLSVASRGAEPVAPQDTHVTQRQPLAERPFRFAPFPTVAAAPSGVQRLGDEGNEVAHPGQGM